jgi:hypothetical protein
MLGFRKRTVREAACEIYLINEEVGIITKTADLPKHKQHFSKVSLIAAMMPEVLMSAFGLELTLATATASAILSHKHVF